MGRVCHFLQAPAQEAVDFQRLTVMKAFPGSANSAGYQSHLLQLCILGQTVRKESGA